MTWGWFLRGLHHHGASAVLLVGGLHLLQTALYGAYSVNKRIFIVQGVPALAALAAVLL